MGWRSRRCLIGLLSLAAFVVLALAASPAVAAEPAAPAPAAPPSDLVEEATPPVEVVAPVEPAPPVPTPPVETPEVAIPASAPSPAPIATHAAASAPDTDTSVSAPKIDTSAPGGTADTVETTANTVEDNRDAFAGQAVQPPKGLGPTLAAAEPAGIEPVTQSASGLLSTPQAGPAKLPSIGSLQIAGIELSLPGNLDGILGAALALVPTDGPQGLPDSLSPTDSGSPFLSGPVDPLGASDALLPWFSIAASDLTNSAIGAAPAPSTGGGDGSPRPGPLGPPHSQDFGAGGSTGTGLILLLGLLAVFVIGIRSLGQRLVNAPAGWRPAPYLSLLERPG